LPFSLGKTLQTSALNRWRSDSPQSALAVNRAGLEDFQADIKSAQSYHSTIRLLSARLPAAWAKSLSHGDFAATVSSADRCRGAITDRGKRGR
jgi:hypothetical protein